MERDESVVGALEYELMLLSRYHLRPNDHGAAVLERSAHILLSRLEHVAPMTIKELAAALRLDGSTVHRQVAALLRRELVSYAPNDGGELARRVTPTAAGLRQLDETRRIYNEGVERVVEPWPKAKRAEFLALLRDFNFEVERLEGGRWPRRTT